MTDLTQGIDFHQEMKMAFDKAMEEFKAIDKVHYQSSQNNIRIGTQLKERLNNAEEAQNQSLKNEAETKKTLENAQKHLDRAKASDIARKEVLEHIYVDEKRVEREGKALERQRKDLEERTTKIIGRESFLTIDEERLKRIRLRVDKLIEANKLKDVVFIDG